ncbi:hypothetical protein DFP72DRAFT_436997 [Ephemerocybe angulata]|uniref:Uncharacterized protein n=1 Tax=Ephemerocybe angulata TaxID=980116 RepID=A0A8H6HV28_9AGAR|nr:hypothetical protein DFP72DRAFT_436997 [Tulosesus angulatus]
MPFETDTHWPTRLVKLFKICRGQGGKGGMLESRYNGPVNAMLTYCLQVGLGEEFDYVIGPQVPADPDHPHSAIDFVVSAVIHDQFKPVLLIEIKDDTWATSATQRYHADAQMRQRFHAMLNACPLPDLHGLSLLGTSLRVYRGTVATYSVDPMLEECPSTEEVPPSNFLEGAWDRDLLSPGGLKEMQRIVSYIVTEVAKLS